VTMTRDPILVRIELSFRTTSDQDVDAYGDRIREAVRMIVGREALDEFRVRTLPLGGRHGPRPVD
jgi:hypothetical protein